MTKRKKTKNADEEIIRTYGGSELKKFFKKTEKGIKK